MEILGIDVGGSGIKAAIVNTETGKMISKRNRIITPQPATPQAIATIIKQQAEHFEWTGAIGCGFPAVVQNGIVKTASNIDKTNIDTNIEVLISQITGLPAFVLNDADAAGLAEATFGSGREKQGLILMITIGTGIGTALIHNGIVIPNSEFGHIFMSNGKIAERYAADAVRTQKALSWQTWGKRFSKYLQMLELYLSPDLILLGGGVSSDFDLFSKYLKLKTPVIPAKLKNKAGIIGAAFYAKHKIEHEKIS